MEQYPNIRSGHDFSSDDDTAEVSFLIADREYRATIGESCPSLLDDWQDEDVIMESDLVEPGYHDWYAVSDKGELQIDTTKAKEVMREVAEVLTAHSKVVVEVGSAVLEETRASKFIPFEDVLELIKNHDFITINAVAAAIAVILGNPRLKFFNNGVVVNRDGDVLVLDDKSGWTEASVILLALAGKTGAPPLVLLQRASAFSYGPPRGCIYTGRADRALVENVPVTSRPDPRIQKYGLDGDGRYADRKYLFFRTVAGKWRKVYLEGNLMFVSGMRGRSMVSKVPVKALEVMGVGFELAEGRKGLEVPTNAMFDLVIRSVNAGNSRLSMWFTPKVLSGEIVCCEGSRTMTCYFRDKVDLPDVEFGPTIRSRILQSGSELGYVVNVGTASYLLADPYDSHGFLVRKVGNDAYHTEYRELPSQDRYLVEDASRMFFGGADS